MAEVFGWIFINSVPLLYEKERVAKQLKIETWLDLSQLVKELRIEKPKQTKPRTHSTMNYIV